MRVLVVGGGAREHALVRSLLADPDVSDVLAAPGNAGIALDVATVPLDVTDAEAIGELAADLMVDLVVVGPEGPLVAGAADAVRARGIACFGPSKAAAALEGSKAFAKDVMAAAGVPTARSMHCASPDEVAAALDALGSPYVVKNDGLAAGKGVVVTTDRDVALAHAAACASVVVEEYLDGPEVSLFAVTDGVTVLPLVPAQDFKRAYDGDAGPNTGGMGAYSPLPWAPVDLVDEVLRDVLQPTVDELARRGTPFVGLLYAGLALTADGVRVIEFNARFGDPETQVVLARLRTPLAGVLHAAAVGGLADVVAAGGLSWSDDAAVTVVLAAPGYPEGPQTGGVISGLDGGDDGGGAGSALVLHAGTAIDPEGHIISTGGRVLCVVATGADLAGARDSAYSALGRISLPGGQFRTDIALAASAP